MTDDDQATAEALDEDLVGDDAPVTSEEVETPFPPDELQGVPFADADVTDESLADRADRSEPEVWERDTAEYDASLAADERLEQVIELPQDEPD